VGCTNWGVKGIFDRKRVSNDLAEEKTAKVGRGGIFGCRLVIFLVHTGFLPAGIGLLGASGFFPAVLYG